MYPSVQLFIKKHSSQKNIQAKLLNFHSWIPLHEKIAELYFLVQIRDRMTGEIKKKLIFFLELFPLCIRGKHMLGAKCFIITNL